MTTRNSDTLFTPDDLLKRADAVSYELVEGKLVERHSGMRSSEIAVRIGVRIGMFLSDNPVGHVFGADAGFQCFPTSPLTVRKPDASFVRSDRLPGRCVPIGHCPVAPDLAAEVISPGDLAYEVEEKITEYLNVGVPLVWVVIPPTDTIRVYRPKTSPRGPISELSGDDTLTGEDVLPGFSCKVSEFFR